MGTIRLLAVTMALTGATLAWSASCTLVKDGAPTSTIVLAKEPTRSAQFAAAELQYHLKLPTM
jgi:hypothetical protein